MVVNCRGIGQNSPVRLCATSASLKGWRCPTCSFNEHIQEPERVTDGGSSNAEDLSEPLPAFVYSGLGYFARSYLMPVWMFMVHFLFVFLFLYRFGDF